MGITARSYAERPTRYFFLEKQLYRKLKISKRQNLIAVERVHDGERMTFLWSDIAKNGQRAFHINKVAEILNCSPNTVFAYHVRGWVDPPAIAEIPNHPIERFSRHRLYSEDHVLELWEVMANTHRGAPRKDGIIVPRKSLPSKAEVLSKMRGGTVLYYKDEAGDYIPLWKAT